MLLNWRCVQLCHYNPVDCYLYVTSYIILFSVTWSALFLDFHVKLHKKKTCCCKVGHINIFFHIFTKESIVNLMLTLAGEHHHVLAKRIWLFLSAEKECQREERGQEVVDWSTRRTQNCVSDPGWDWKLYADIWGATLDIRARNATSCLTFIQYHLYSVQQECISKILMLLHDAGYASGLPGDVHSVWLCGALLLCVSPGGHVCSYQQHHRDPQRCPEALHRPAEALWTESGEHWTVAGQCVLFFKMSDKPSRLHYSCWVPG